jgi:hypothetical protein
VKENEMTPKTANELNPRPVTLRFRCEGDPVASLNPDLLAENLRVWRERSQRTLTPEDARQIINNAAGLAAVLAAWAAADDARVDR